MRIKRIIAPDMRRAIQLVRHEQGPDAVILSSRSVEGGIEIVSALDYDENLVTQLAAQSATETPVARAETAPEGARHQGPESGRRAAIEWSPDPGLLAVQRELSAMKGVMREQFAQLAWAELAKFQPERARLIRRIEALGVDSTLARELAAEAGDAPDINKAWRQVVLALGRRIQVTETDPIDAGGVVALVGPTGVGKTTTIAKLAARHCLRYGAESLALISTDSYRVGAVRQLEAFGAILGVPVRAANTAAELKTLLETYAARRLVLVDTAGLAPRDCRLAGSMSVLAAHSDVRTYLVLAANMQASVMRDAVRSFGGGGHGENAVAGRSLAGIAWTKLDEANGLGAVVSTLIAEQLPAVWLGNGQRVPEDLMLARSVHLLSWAARTEAAPDVDLAPDWFGATLPDGTAIGEHAGVACA